MLPHGDQRPCRGPRAAVIGAQAADGGKSSRMIAGRPVLFGSLLGLILTASPPAPGAEVCLGSPSGASSQARVSPRELTAAISEMVQNGYGPLIGGSLARADLAFTALQDEAFLRKSPDPHYKAYYDWQKRTIYLRGLEPDRDAVIHETAHAIDHLLYAANFGEAAPPLEGMMLAVDPDGGHLLHISTAVSNPRYHAYTFVKGTAVHDLYTRMAGDLLRIEEEDHLWSVAGGEMEACRPLLRRASAGEPLGDDLRSEADYCLEVEGILAKGRPGPYGASRLRDKFVREYAASRVPEFFAVGVEYYLDPARNAELERTTPALHAILKGFLQTGCLR